MTEPEIASAIDKIRAERQKVLNEARIIIQRNDRDGLLFLAIHQNHLVRVVRIAKSDELGINTQALCSLAADAYAYALQLIYKYGRRHDGVRLDDYYRLIEISRFVNNGLEMETLLNCLPFQRFGERLQHFKIYLDGVKADEDRSRIFDYAARHELDSALRHANWMTVEDLISELFPTSMDPECSQVFGLTTQEVSEFFSALTREVSSKLVRAEQKMPEMTPGHVDAMRLDAFEAARFAYTVDYDAFLDQFGARKKAFRNFLLQQMLRREEIDESELKHFAIWRHHILRLDRHHFTFSPEVTTFSPNIGLHYALLEDPSTKDSYQAKRAVQFEGRVESCLRELGLQIVAKNLDATSGKTDLGDVDILAEDSESYFNIECKGAVLPLRVYFHDFEYIRNVHLPYLRDQKGWDRKVVAREQWLNAKRQELGLSRGKPLISVVVSDSPEIISHYSSTLCLSRHEFPLWYLVMKKLSRFVGFDEFQEQVLRKRMITVAKDSRGEIEGYMGVRFASETP